MPRASPRTDQGTPGNAKASAETRINSRGAGVQALPVRTHNSMRMALLPRACSRQHGAQPTSCSRLLRRRYAPLSECLCLFAAAWRSAPHACVGRLYCLLKHAG